MERRGNITFYVRDDNQSIIKRFEELIKSDKEIKKMQNQKRATSLFSLAIIRLMDEYNSRRERTSVGETNLNEEDIVEEEEDATD